MGLDYTSFVHIYLLTITVNDTGNQLNGLFALVPSLLLYHRRECQDTPGELGVWR